MLMKVKAILFVAVVSLPTVAVSADPPLLAGEALRRTASVSSGRAGWRGSPTATS
jgi:hypothetical protein